MRIAFHVPRASYLRPGSSGDTTSVRNMVAGLTALGHQVKIVSTLNVRDFWRGRLPAWRIAGEALRVRAEMRRFRPNAWLVYGASITDADLFGWWQCRGRYVLIHARGGRGRRLPPLWRRLFRFAHLRSLARADGAAAVLPVHAQELQLLGVPPERVHILPLAAGELGPLLSRREARTRLGLPEDASIVLCVTRMPPLGWGADKTDAVFDLVASFAALAADCFLVIVGGGEGRAQVEMEVERLRIASRVRLVGSVPHEDVGPFFAACDVYAYPYPGGLPFVAMIEAQLAGRPVLAMRSPSNEAIVEHGRTGLLADDLEEFGTQLAALVGDRARCAAMGQTARDYAAAHHSIETRVKQVESLLRGAGPSE